MRLRRTALTAALTVLGALATAGPAAAFPCDQTLTDPAGFTWTMDEYGELTDGGKTGEAGDPFGGPALDGYPQVVVARAGNDPLFQASTYVVGANACAVGNVPDEILYPERPMSPNTPELLVSRQIYVPAAGRAFARMVDTLRNTSNTTRSYDLVLLGQLGSDCGTRLGTSSDGDTFPTRRDRWMTTYDPVAGNESCPNVFFNTPNPDASTGLPLALNWDGPGAADRADEFAGFAGFTLPGGFPHLKYEDLTLAPGQSLSLVHFISQTTTTANNTLSPRDAAIAIDAEPNELWVGLSDAERLRVRNWCIDDCDKDAVPDAGDNCKGLANPGQLNTDKDAQGDACDADDDNDGRSDAVEIGIGTNPRSAKDAAPRVTRFSAPRTAVRGRRVTMTARATDDYGVRRVTFFAANRRLCIDRVAPFRCTWRFGEKGTKPIAAVATDAIGQAAARTRTIKVTPP